MSALFSTAPASGYDPLATSEWGAGKPVPLSVRASRILKRRRVVYGIAALVACTLLIVLATASPGRLREWRQKPEEKVEEPQQPQVMPPLYPEYHIEELKLPQQQDTRNPFENGRKYMWVADHTQCKQTRLLRALKTG